MKIRYLPFAVVRDALELYSPTTGERMFGYAPRDQNPPWWLISITEGQGDLPLNPCHLQEWECRGVLSLAFHDFDPKKSQEPGLLPFNSGHAQNVIKFIDGIHQNHHLIIHCTAGISRSGAVAKFAAEYTGTPWEEVTCFYAEAIPNIHVLSTLRAEAGLS